jgi:hypothetical protein
MNRPGVNGDEHGESIGEIDLDKMKRYIAYCKAYVPLSCLSWIDGDERAPVPNRRLFRSKINKKTVLTQT